MTWSFDKRLGIAFPALLMILVAMMSAADAACTKADFEVWYGGDAGDYDGWIKNRKNAGFRPIYAHNFYGARAMYVSGIIVKKDGPGWTSTMRSFEDTFTKDWKAGECFTWISGYSASDTSHYISWMRESECGTTQYSLAGISGSALVEAWGEAHDKGYMIRSLAAYGVSSSRFAVIFEKVEKVYGSSLRVDMDFAAVGRYNTQANADHDHWMELFVSYAIGSKMLYAGYWTGRGHGRSSVFNWPAGDLYKNNDAMEEKGMIPLTITGAFGPDLAYAALYAPMDDICKRTFPALTDTAATQLLSSTQPTTPTSSPVIIPTPNTTAANPPSTAPINSPSPSPSPSPVLVDAPPSIESSPKFGDGFILSQPPGSLANQPPSSVDQQTQHSNNSPPDNKSSTVIIVASVVGASAAVVLGVAGFYVWKHYAGAAAAAAAEPQGSLRHYPVYVGMGGSGPQAPTGGSFASPPGSGVCQSSMHSSVHPSTGPTYDAQYRI